MIASDDIYEHNCWTPFNNILNACPELKDRCIVINGVSKTYAMTGWRIGYAAGPVKIIASMKKAQSQSTSNPASISQYAATAALNGDQSCVKAMTAAYQERHQVVYQALQGLPGIKCLPSDGTFYIFPSIEGLLNKDGDLPNDLAFTEMLLNEAQIAVVPGSAFGLPGYIRISYATSMENILKAIEKLQQVITNRFSTLQVK